MPDRTRDFCEERERYQSAPDRYSQVSSINSVGELFKNLGKKWETNREVINYADLGSGNCSGTSVFVNFLEKYVGLPVNATGIDASISCEAQCLEKKVNFIRLDLDTDQIPLRDLQVATLFETIEHVFDPDFLLESIRKSIADDGVLLVTTLNVVCWKNRILVPLGIQPFNTEVSTKKLTYGYRFDFLKKRMSAWKPAGHIRPYTLHSLCDIIDDNGFQVVKSYGLENWGAFRFLEAVAKNMCTSILVIAKPR